MPSSAKIPLAILPQNPLPASVKGDSEAFVRSTACSVSTTYSPHREDSSSKINESRCSYEPKYAVCSDSNNQYLYHNHNHFEDLNYNINVNALQDLAYDALQNTRICCKWSCFASFVLVEYRDLSYLV